MLYKSSLTYFGMGLEDEDYPASEVIPVGPYLESRMEFQDDVLQIQYRGAELKLPAGVDMDAVAALLRSLQSL